MNREMKTMIMIFLIVGALAVLQYRLLRKVLVTL